MTKVATVFLCVLGACSVGNQDESVESQYAGSWWGIENKKEAVLEFLNQSSGQKILSGQESTLWDTPWGDWFPSSRDEYVSQRSGKLPAVFSSDFGDFKNRDLGSEEQVREKRSMVVNTAKQYARQGSLVMLSYHMCPPDLQSGCAFEQMSRFTQDDPYPEWKLNQILQPGTEMNRKHLERIDEIAGYLKELEDEGIVVMWRPFHEINKSWFWWGASSRSADLYRQMHDRMVGHHGLKNLIWVYSVNYWDGENDSPRRYYPGDWYVDMLGVDIYIEHGHEYSQRIYDGMMDLADDNQPIAITENGMLPEDFHRFRNEQPNWVLWATWFGYESRWPDFKYSDIYNHEDVVTRDEMYDF